MSGRAFGEFCVVDDELCLGCCKLCAVSVVCWLTGLNRRRVVQSWCQLWLLLSVCHAFYAFQYRPTLVVSIPPSNIPGHEYRHNNHISRHTTTIHCVSSPRLLWPLLSFILWPSRPYHVVPHSSIILHLYSRFLRSHSVPSYLQRSKSYNFCTQDRPLYNINMDVELHTRIHREPRV